MAGVCIDQGSAWKTGEGCRSLNNGAVMRRDQLSGILANEKVGESDVPKEVEDLVSAAVEKERQVLEERYAGLARTQVRFLQEEHSRMLLVLHQQIERLQNHCSGLTVQLAEAQAHGGKDSPVARETAKEAPAEKQQQHQPRASPRRSDASSATSDEEKSRRLKSELDRCQLLLNQLESSRREMEGEIRHLAKRLQSEEMDKKTALARKDREIKELTEALHVKSAAIAQLAAQLKQVRVKESVEKQRAEMGDRTRAVSTTTLARRPHPPSSPYATTPVASKRAVDVTGAPVLRSSDFGAVTPGGGQRSSLGHLSMPGSGGHLVSAFGSTLPWTRGGSGGAAGMSKVRRSTLPPLVGTGSGGTHVTNKRMPPPVPPKPTQRLPFDAPRGGPPSGGSAITSINIDKPHPGKPAFARGSLLRRSQQEKEEKKEEE